MNSAMAWSLIIVGVIPFAWAIAAWHKSRTRHQEDKKIHHKWVAAMLIVGCLLLGAGTGAIIGVNPIEDKIGYIPLWVPIVFILAGLFALEFKGYKDDDTRTPVLGGITAFVLFLAVGSGLVSGVSNTITHAQVTGVVQQAKK